MLGFLEELQTWLGSHEWSAKSSEVLPGYKSPSPPKKKNKKQLHDEVDL